MTNYAPLSRFTIATQMEIFRMESSLLSDYCKLYMLRHFGNYADVYRSSYSLPYGQTIFNISRLLTSPESDFSVVYFNTLVVLPSEDKTYLQSICIKFYITNPLGNFIRLCETDHYLNGLRNGRCSWWHPNGVLADTRTYKNGKPTGYYYSFYSNGKPFQSGRYIDGLRIGYWLVHYYNGHIQFSGWYDKNGREHGRWICWAEDGHITFSGDYSQSGMPITYVTGEPTNQH